MNLVANVSAGYQFAPIEGEILSTNGRVKVLDLEIPPYPKLLHLSTLNKKMLAQKKVNGYNIRLAYLPRLTNFIALLRGGYVCAQTTLMLRKGFSSVFMKFFGDHQKKVLVMEVLGKKSLANLHIDYYKQNYGFEDIGYFVFDIMDLERPEDERFLQFVDVKQICETYDLQLIPLLGSIDTIDELNEKLREVSSVFEGVVVKSLNGRERLKYRFNQKPELFADKLPKKKEKKLSSENIIVAHFFQGYEEAQLGLDSGISQEEMDQYQQRLNKMKLVIAGDRHKIGEESIEVIQLLIEMIKKHGTFDEERLKAIEKILKKRVSSQVGKNLKIIKKDNS